MAGLLFRLHICTCMIMEHHHYCSPLSGHLHSTVHTVWQVLDARCTGRHSIARRGLELALVAEECFKYRIALFTHSEH